MTISSTSVRRRKIRLDSEGTNELSSNLPQSISKGQRRKTSASVDIDTAKPGKMISKLGFVILQMHIYSWSS